MRQLKRKPMIERVHIFEIDDEFRVYPPVTVLDAEYEDEIELVNHTDHDAEYYFGPGLLEPGAVSGVVKKGKRDKRKPKPGDENQVRIGRYQVTRSRSRKKAKANSDPVIIIDN